MYKRNIARVSILAIVSLIMGGLVLWGMPSPKISYKKVDGIKQESATAKQVNGEALLNTVGTATAPEVRKTWGKGHELLRAKSDTAKVLVDCHTYAATGQYDKVLLALDDTFVVKLNILTQFGISELTKKDISIEKLSIYGEAFKTAEIERIVEEKTIGNNSTIYFYHIISADSKNLFKQPLIAKLRKSDKVWKLTHIGSGNENEKPFKK
ncbi:MAG: hypothetical protein N3B21_15340 [Clostridia bacterium]|nr:hypothetical protein [Clostridia bacterium]